MLSDEVLKAIDALPVDFRIVVVLADLQSLPQGDCRDPLLPGRHRDVPALPGTSTPAEEPRRLRLRARHSDSTRPGHGPMPRQISTCSTAPGGEVMHRSIPSASSTAPTFTISPTPMSTASSRPRSARYSNIIRDLCGLPPGVATCRALRSLLRARVATSRPPKPCVRGSPLPVKSTASTARAWEGPFWNGGAGCCRSWRSFLQPRFSRFSI